MHIQGDIVLQPAISRPLGRLPYFHQDEQVYWDFDVTVGCFFFLLSSKPRTSVIITAG